MAPFTPFFCETLYRNLRRALLPGAPESVHWCDFPEAAAAQARPRTRPQLDAACAGPARHGGPAGRAARAACMWQGASHSFKDAVSLGRT